MYKTFLNSIILLLDFLYINYDLALRNSVTQMFKKIIYKREVSWFIHISKFILQLMYRFVK